MKSHRWAMTLVALLAALAIAPAAVRAAGPNVEVWTDRGDDAVYDPGEVLQVQARTSADAYLLVYELDAEGFVRLLFPYRGNNGLVPGGEVLDVPDPHSNLELVVQDPVGQAYIVAIASPQPFAELPWYLRPYDAHAEGVGYEGEADEEEGVTAEGRIVGDPFVAMEKIRRRVVAAPDDPDAFATAYTAYYVHEEVKYPRYLCYDCHRPGHWAWWTGFDPYYTTCSTFEFRVNYGWYWGPGYWFGTVPYYWYVPRYDCAPVYRTYPRYSAWGGWTRWKTMWGASLTRYKTAPPPGYVGPPRFGDPRRVKDGVTPPGYIAAGRGAAGIGTRLPIGRRSAPGAPLPAHDPATRDRAWRNPADTPAPESAERGERVERAPRFERGRSSGAPRDEDRRVEREPRTVERPGVEGRRGRAISNGDASTGRFTPRMGTRPTLDRRPQRFEQLAPRVERPTLDRRAPRLERPAPARDDGGRFERVAERAAPRREAVGRVERAHGNDAPAPARVDVGRSRGPEPRGQAPQGGGRVSAGGHERGGRSR